VTRRLSLAVVAAVLLAVGCSASTPPTLVLKPLTPPTTPGNDGGPAVQ
jgi:hypothetical protein